MSKYSTLDFDIEKSIDVLKKRIFGTSYLAVELSSSFFCKCWLLHTFPKVVQILQEIMSVFFFSPFSIFEKKSFNIQNLLLVVQQEGHIDSGEAGGPAQSLPLPDLLL